jgi:hypothetical protein
MVLIKVRVSSMKMVCWDWRRRRRRRVSEERKYIVAEKQRIFME